MYGELPPEPGRAGAVRAPLRIAGDLRFNLPHPGLGFVAPGPDLGWGDLGPK